MIELAFSRLLFCHSTFGCGIPLASHLRRRWSPSFTAIGCFNSSIFAPWKYYARLNGCLKAYLYSQTYYRWWNQQRTCNCPIYFVSACSRVSVFSIFSSFTFDLRKYFFFALYFPLQTLKLAELHYQVDRVAQEYLRLRKKLCKIYEANKNISFPSPISPPGPWRPGGPVGPTFPVIM